MFAPAKEILMEQVQGGKGRKIECKLVECPVHDLARSLIEEAKTGNYDTVVLGRHGRSRIVDYALGGLTSKIIHNLRGRTVWVVE